MYIKCLMFRLCYIQKYVSALLPVASYDVVEGYIRIAVAGFRKSFSEPGEC